MIYLGMDVSSKIFVGYAINEKKKVVFEGEVEPTRLGLRRLIGKLGKETKLVVFEAGNQLKWIALTLKKMEGVEIHVVHPNEIKWISESSGKTDKIDAKTVSAPCPRGHAAPEGPHSRREDTGVTGADQREGHPAKQASSINQQFTRTDETGGVSAAGEVFSKSGLGRNPLETEGWPDSEEHYRELHEGHREFGGSRRRVN